MAGVGRAAGRSGGRPFGGIVRGAGETIVSPLNAKLHQLTADNQPHEAVSQFPRRLRETPG